MIPWVSRSTRFTPLPRHGVEGGDVPEAEPGRPRAGVHRAPGEPGHDGEVRGSEPVEGHPLLGCHEVARPYPIQGGGGVARPKAGRHRREVGHHPAQAEVGVAASLVAADFLGVGPYVEDGERAEAALLQAKEVAEARPRVSDHVQVRVVVEGRAPAEEPPGVILQVHRHALGESREAAGVGKHLWPVAVPLQLPEELAQARVLEVVEGEEPPDLLRCDRAEEVAVGSEGDGRAHEAIPLSCGAPIAIRTAFRSSWSVVVSTPGVTV